MRREARLELRISHRWPPPNAEGAPVVRPVHQRDSHHSICPTCRRRTSARTTTHAHDRDEACDRTTCGRGRREDTSQEGREQTGAVNCVRSLCAVYREKKLGIPFMHSDTHIYLLTPDGTGKGGHCSAGMCNSPSVLVSAE